MKKGIKVKIISDCRYKGKFGKIIKNVLEDLYLVKMDKDLIETFFKEHELQELGEKNEK